jgi:signal transduction histidine kinase
VILGRINSFYSKVALSIIASLILVGVLLLSLALQLTRSYQQEVEQKLHLELAEHIAHDNALLKNGEIDSQALEHAFHSMMILGPSFEFYILDPQGQVTTYSADPGKVKRETVDLLPVRNLLSGATMLPILGDDPRSYTNQKIFSAAPIRDGEELIGYLYIIIGGEIYDNIVELLQKSHIVKLSFWGLVGILLFVGCVMLMLFALITRPLRRLANDMHEFKSRGFEQGELQLDHWHGNAQDEVSRLGVTFEEMAGTLKKQYQKVKNTDELRRELISYVSHDLRTPLASLQGYLETWQLKHHDLTPEENENLIQTAINNSTQISHLIEQLFELAHLEGDDVVLHREPVAVAELIQDLFQKLHIDNERKLTLEVTPKDPSLVVMADIEKLERLLTNLIDNAIRHCRDGDSVKVILERVDEGVKLSVEDNGVGIPDEDIAHIFEPHYRASNSIKSKGRNSGLGLAITRRLVELHHSVISVNSRLGEGTCFSFTLPT